MILEAGVIFPLQMLVYRALTPGWGPGLSPSLTSRTSLALQGPVSCGPAPEAHLLRVTGSDPVSPAPPGGTEQSRDEQRAHSVPCLPACPPRHPGGCLNNSRPWLRAGGGWT